MLSREPGDEKEDSAETTTSRRNYWEIVKRIWFDPVLSCAQLNCGRWGEFKFNGITKESIISFFKILLIIICILLQVLFFIAFIMDMIYRPLLFIRIHTGILNVTDPENKPNISLISLVIVTSPERLYHQYENWFLFTWDYLYGLIALYSTAFLFITSWNVHYHGHDGFRKLISNISEFKEDIQNAERDFREIKGEKEKPTCSEQFISFISFSDKRVQKLYSQFRWGIAHLFVIVSSCLLVVYWIIINVIGWFLNSQSSNFVTQDSNIALVLMILDSFHWHIAPVIVCFLIRIACMEVTTHLDKLCYEYVQKVICSKDERLNVQQQQGDPPVAVVHSNVLEDASEIQPVFQVHQPRQPIELWKDFYQRIKRVSAITNQYQRISSINITILIFSVVRISVHYITEDTTIIDGFLSHDWIDLSRFILWYLVHLVSVWFMVDAMATLNYKLDHFTDDIMVLFSDLESPTIPDDIQKQLDLCRHSKTRFSMSFFGVVTRGTVTSVIGFGAGTIMVFLVEAMKLALYNV